MLLPFEPVLLRERLPVDSIGSFLTEFMCKTDGQADLVRRRPDSTLWHSVLTRQRTIDSLTDVDVQSLHYLHSGVHGSK